MRYTGPKWKINRREGSHILGTSEKWKKRPGNPGQHPFSRGKGSDYAIQFREKQKVKRMYGMSERQFVKFYKLALKSTGNTSTRLLQLLEMRLDSVLFKLGFAATRSQARQFITHGHILLNGKKHNIPSYIAKEGDEIVMKDSIKSNVQIIENKQKSKSVATPAWLASLENGGKIVSQPQRDEIDPSIKEQRIIELYSRN